jgi:glyoxylase I family protein
MIKGLHHISIIASSEKTVEFYGKLGFKETFREKRPNDSIVFLDGYGIRLVLFIDSSHPPRDLNPEQLGVRYFALKVDNIEKIIEQHGGSPIKIDWNGERYCILKDPDGLCVQMHE